MINLNECVMWYDSFVCMHLDRRLLYLILWFYDEVLKKIIARRIRNPFPNFCIDWSMWLEIELIYLKEHQSWITRQVCFWVYTFMPNEWVRSIFVCFSKNANNFITIVINQSKFCYRMVQKYVKLNKKNTQCRHGNYCKRDFSCRFLTSRKQCHCLCIFWILCPLDIVQVKSTLRKKMAFGMHICSVYTTRQPVYIFK